MRRFHVTVAAVGAISALLAFGATGALAETIKKKKVIGTTVTMAYKPGAIAEEYTGATFSGKVGSPNSRCVRSRGIVVELVNGPNVGQTQSAGNGDWSVLTATSAVKPGEQYAVKVAKEKFLKEKTKPNGDRVRKKIVCQPDSETITIP